MDAKRTFTGLVRWPSGDAEEIEVRASDLREARRMIIRELAGYEPGWKLGNVRSQGGSTLYFAGYAV